MSNPCLPQKDPAPAKRKQRLEATRVNYQYNYEYLPPVPLLDEVPHEETFSAEYVVERFSVLPAIATNNALAKARSLFDPFDKIDDFADLFTILPQPASVNTWRTDFAFSEQRLSGANPMTLTLVTDLGAMPLMDSVLINGNLPGTPHTPQQALAERRLYMSDYSSFAPYHGGTWAKGRKYLPAPRVVFYWRDSGTGFNDRALGQLAPVGIEIVRGGAVHNPYHCGPTEWLIAKLAVQIADANHHEMSSHLTRTHFVMEPFAIATGRQLADNHPLGILLRQHFRFMLANNKLGRTQLINPGGPVDRLLAGTLQESMSMVKAAYKSWDARKNAFPNEVAQRGLADKLQLPHFPYRDDGQLLWDAIVRYVYGYLRLYYRLPADLVNDPELQEWARDLSTDVPGQGFRVTGMPAKLAQLPDLVQLVANIIFTCGPQHGAVNFSQYDYMAYVPNMPFAAYCPVDSIITGPQASDATEADLMRLLPPVGQSQDQLGTMEFLTSYHYDKLGFYKGKPFVDERVQPLVATFQQELYAIEDHINRRNQARAVPYKFMKPSEILNSISI